jgi:hypothetical protein
MARGFVSLESERTVAGFEVILPAETSGPEIAEAFSALSVACNAGAGGILALEDGMIAREYLRTNGETAVNKTESGGAPGSSSARPLAPNKNHNERKNT